MHQSLGFLCAYFGPESIPSGDAGFLFLLVVLVLVLVAVIGEVHHEFVFALDVHFVIALESETQVPGVKQHQARLAVDEQVAPNVKFAIVD